MTPSRPSNSPRATVADYGAFVGREYERPHGCFVLVRQVFEEAYGWDVLAHADQGLDLLDPDQRNARLHEYLARYARDVFIEEADEGDVVVIRARPYHLGVVVRPGEMLHSYMGGSAVIERYRDPNWWPRLLGCYRVEATA